MGVVLLEHLRSDRGCNELAHFLRGRPQVTQEDRLAVDIGSNRVFRQVDVYSACQRISDDQGGRSQEAGAHLRMDAPLKIAVPDQDGSDNVVVFIYLVCNMLPLRAASANAIVD